MIIAAAQSLLVLVVLLDAGLGSHRLIPSLMLHYHVFWPREVVVVSFYMAAPCTPQEAGRPAAAFERVGSTAAATSARRGRSDV